MRKLGPLQCLDLVQNPDAPWVILFHGFGADANDLASLADVIPVSKTCNFLFPQGPLEVPIGPGWTGRAWWTIDMDRLQRDAQLGQDRDMGAEKPTGLPAAREKAFKMIEALKVPWNKIILGGFSQGGMLAVDLALHAPEQPLGLVVLSSSILNKEEWKAKIAQRKDLPFYQSHGENDAVLSLKNAQRLETFLTQGGLKGRLQKFPGGHEIPAPVISRLGSWLNDLL